MMRFPGLRRLFRLDRPADVERNVDAELRFHLDLKVRELMDRGLSESEARHEAERRFGDVALTRERLAAIDRERVGQERRTEWWDALFQDLRYAARMLRRNAGFTAVVVLTLSLGIGANTSIFTLVNAVLLRALPVRDPQRLVAVGEPSRVGGLSISTSPRVDLLSYPLYTDLRSQNQLTTGLLASGRAPRLAVAPQSRDAEMEHPRGRFVSGNYFSVLGVPALLGRTFDAREDGAFGGSPAATISYAYWTRRFHRDSSAVGRTLVVNGVGLTIVGVTPPWFQGEIVGGTNDIWLPITMQPVLMPHQPLLGDRNISWLLLLGRLAPGVDLAQASAGFEALIRKNVGDHQPGSPEAVALQVKAMTTYVSSGARGFSRVRSTYQTPLLTLMIGVALLLVIVCGNVANLLLARAVARGREMSVRLALGAARARLLRQLLTESLALALLGAAGGLLVSYWGSRLLLALAADGAAVIPLELRLDLPVLGFTAAISVLAVGLFGLVPALRASKVDLASVMRAHARSLTGVLGGRGQRVPLGRLLIAGQIALSLVLLTGAGLLVRSLQGLQSADTGLDRDHLLIAEVDARGRGYGGDRLYNLARDLTSRFAAIPGVAAVTFSENGIFSGTESANTFQVPGFLAHNAGDSAAFYDEAGPNYVHAVGARLLEGRDFTERDDEHAERVALVNETMARFYWPGTSALGKVLQFNPTTRARIVGVIADARDHDLVAAPVRRFYVAYLQRTFEVPCCLRFEIRAGGDPAALANVVRAQIKAADPSLTIGGIDALSVLMRQSIREDRLLTRLAAGFGAMALLLAGIGLYGVMTYAITQRTGEIGLRTALGAQRGDVIRMVLGDAGRVVAIGAVTGVPLALMAARLLKGQLHGVSSADPLALTIALLVLMLSAFAAALLPALRASRVAPLVALNG